MDKPKKRDIYALPLNRTLRDLLLEITNLDNDFGCVASNEFLANSLRLRLDTVSKYISNLKKLGYVKQEKFNGRVRTLRSIFSANLSGAEPEFQPNQSPIKAQGIEQSRGLPAKPDPDKKPIHSTSNSTSYKLHPNNKETEVQKVWNEFLTWSRQRLTSSSNEILSKLKYSINSQSVTFEGEINTNLKNIISRYFKEEKGLKVEILFVIEKELPASTDREADVIEENPNSSALPKPSTVKVYDFMQHRIKKENAHGFMKECIVNSG